MHKSFVFRINQGNCASTCLADFKYDADLVHLAVSSDQNLSTTFLSYRGNLSYFSPTEYEGTEGSTCYSNTTSPPLVPDMLSIEYSYTSKSKGYLFLEPNDTLLESLTVQYIIVSPQDLRCFGDGALQILVWNMGIGWDTILLNWLLVFNEPDHPAFVYHSKTNRLLELDLPLARSSSYTSYYVRLALNKLSVIIQTSFLFFFCTTLVSFTLNETQERMLDFTQELSLRVGQNLPLGNLVTTHVLNSIIFCPLMVGKFFFLIEFYNGDRFLAFLFMTLVWCVEVYTVLSLRSFHGVTYFPRLLFLLFCLFHIYYFANPKIGFSYVAFWVVVLFIVHSMMFFWHRYELPAVAFGYINIQRPRANATLHPTQPVLRTPPRVQRTTRAANGNGRENSSSDLIQSSANLAPSERFEGGGLDRSHPSFSTTTSSSSYRNSLLFRPESSDRADEDDASFDYFLQGEVVVHRIGRQTTFQENYSNHGEEVTRHMDDAPNMDATPSASDNMRRPMHGARSTATGDPLDEPSGLQAVTEVRLTRRHTAIAQSKTTDSATASPPAFPQLPP